MLSLVSSRAVSPDAPALAWPQGTWSHVLTTTDPYTLFDLTEHVLQVRERARVLGRAIGLERLSALIALFHDAGKSGDGFQRYLYARALAVWTRTEPPRVGSQEHAQGGAHLLFARFPDPLRLLVALPIWGHHAGLPAAFPTALRLQGAYAQPEALNRFEALIAPYEETEDDPQQDPLWQHLLALPPADRMRGLEMVARMATGVLVDADHTSVEAALRPQASARREARSHRLTPALLRRFQERIAADQLQRQAACPVKATALLRDAVARLTREAATDPRPYKSLCVPTGSGKTLAMFAGALRYAEITGKERLVYVAPHTTLLDQVYEAAVALFGAENVLLHHHAVDTESGEGSAGWCAGTEDWNRPVVITTMVQFSAAVHGAKTAALRRLPRLANAIIVCDEPQDVPVGLLAPFLDSLVVLERDYKTAFLFGSATLPPAFRPHGAPGRLPVEKMQEIVSATDPLWAGPRRYRMRLTEAPWSLETLAAEAAEASGSVLVCRNTRAGVYAAAQALRAAVGRSRPVFALGRFQTPAHLSRHLAEVRESLSAAAKGRAPAPIVVATSLIQTGVDLDFGSVFQEETSLVAMAQIAGRLNRHGARPWEEALLTIFTVRDATLPPDLRQGAEIARAALEDWKDETGDYPDHLEHPSLVEDYFTRLYSRQGYGGLDARHVNAVRDVWDFPEIATRMELISDEGTPVLVYDAPEVAFLERLARQADTNQERLTRTQRQNLLRHCVTLSQAECRRHADQLERLYGQAIWLWREKRAYEADGDGLAPALYGTMPAQPQARAA